MSNAGYSTLSIIPSAKGFGTKLTAEATPQMAAAGAALGKVFIAGAVLAAAAIAAFAVKGVQSFATLQSGMNEVFTLLPSITETAMQSMTDDVRAFAVEMGTTTDKVVPALYQAISAGVPAGNVFDFLEVAQKAALGGVTDLTTAVDGISGVINSYGAEVISASEASDLMFTAVRLGKTTFPELSNSLFQVLPTATSLGVGFGDITAAIAAMTAQTIPTKIATTQMRQMFIELSKAGGDTAKIFEDVSGQTFKNFIASGGSVNDALDLMGTYAEDNNLLISDLFGSVEGGQAALALFDNSAFTSGIAEMGDAAGATDAAYAQMDQGISRTWDRVKSTFSDALLEIGDRLAPSIQTMATWFSENLPGAIDTTFAALDTVQAFIADTVAPAFQTFFDALTGRSELGEFEGALGNINDAGVILGGMLEALSPVAEFAKKAWDELYVIWVEKVQPALDDLATRFREDVMPELNNLTATLDKDVRPAFESLTDFMSKYVLPVVKFFIDMWIFYAKIFVSDVLPVIIKIGGWIADYITWYVQTAIDVVSTLIDGFLWLGRTASGVASSIGSAFRSTFNGIASMWNRSVGKLSFTIPDIVGVPNRGETFRMPRIPYMADGGIVSKATLSMVGEAGPEAVMPLSKLDEMLAGKGGNQGGPIRLHADDIQALGQVMLAGANVAAAKRIDNLERDLKMARLAGAGTVTA